MNKHPQDYVPPPPPVEKIGIYTLPPAWLRNNPKAPARPSCSLPRPSADSAQAELASPAETGMRSA